MGVLNVTPDSFSDGGLYQNLDKALEYAEEMVRFGADIIDIGGESSRPNATPVSLDIELERVIPVIENLTKKIAIPISIDTTKVALMRAAIDAGASIINDISSLNNQDKMRFAKQSSAKICLVHMQGTPQLMQKNPTYENVVLDILTFFKKKIIACEKHGIQKSRLIIDPGFGFGKTFTHNITLLKNLSKFKSLGCPILVGLSRKSMIDNLLGGNTKPKERILGSIIAGLVASRAGANIIRTHDVAKTKEALNIWHQLT